MFVFFKDCFNFSWQVRLLFRFSKIIIIVFIVSHSSSSVFSTLCPFCLVRSYFFQHASAFLYNWQKYFTSSVLTYWTYHVAPRRFDLLSHEPYSFSILVALELSESSFLYSPGLWGHCLQGVRFRQQCCLQFHTQLVALPVISVQSAVAQIIGYRRPTCKRHIA